MWYLTGTLLSYELSVTLMTSNCMFQMQEQRTKNILFSLSQYISLLYFVFIIAFVVIFAVLPVISTENY